MGPRTQAFEAQFAEHLGVQHAIAPSSCTAALHLAYLAAGVGPGRRGDRARDHLRGHAPPPRATAAPRRCWRTSRGQHDLGIDPERRGRADHRRARRRSARCTTPATPADVARLRELCDPRRDRPDRGRGPPPSATAAGGGRKLGAHGLAGCFSFFSNKVLSCGEGGLLATDDDGVAEQVRSLRSHAMTSGTWDRHRGHAAGYDVVGAGLQLPHGRAARGAAAAPACPSSRTTSRRGAGWCTATASCSPACPA